MRNWNWNWKFFNCSVILFDLLHHTIKKVIIFHQYFPINFSVNLIQEKKIYYIFFSWIISLIHNTTRKILLSKHLFETTKKRKSEKERKIPLENIIDFLTTIFLLRSTIINWHFPQIFIKRIIKRVIKTA